MSRYGFRHLTEGDLGDADLNAIPAIISTESENAVSSFLDFQRVRGVEK
jgi:hypothetical protein